MRSPVPARPPRRQARREARRVPVLPLLLVLLLAAAAAGAFLLLRDDDEPQQGGAAADVPVQLTGVASFDPQGDNEEHSERVADATDGDPATYWTTERYQAFTKGGVGLVLEVAGAPSQLAVTTDTPGYTAEIRAGASAQGPFDQVVGEAKTVEGTTTWELDTDARFLTVWITSLETVAHVNEAKAS